MSQGVTSHMFHPPAVSAIIHVLAVSAFMRIDRNGRVFVRSEVRLITGSEKPLQPSVGQAATVPAATEQQQNWAFL